MKAIRTKEVNENVKAANSCLRKAKWQAKELAVFTGEVVRLMGFRMRMALRASSSAGMCSISSSALE